MAWEQLLSGVWPQLECCHGDNCQQEPTGSPVDALAARAVCHQTMRHSQPPRKKRSELFSWGAPCLLPKGRFILA